MILKRDTLPTKFLMCLGLAAGLLALGFLSGANPIRPHLATAFSQGVPAFSPALSPAPTAPGGAVQSGSWADYTLSPTMKNLRGVSMVPSGGPPIGGESGGGEPGGEAWAVGDGGVILHYHDGGWSDATPADADEFQQLTWYGVSMASPTVGWAAGDYFDISTRVTRGILGRYDGTQWSILTGETATTNGAPIKPLRSVYMPTSEDGFAVGLDGEILHFYDHIWHREIPTGPSFYTVGGAGPDWAWVSGDAGKQLFFDGGGGWKSAGIWTHATVNSTSFVDHDYGWFTTDGVGVLLYDGAAFSCPDNCKTQNLVISQLAGSALRAVKMVSRADGWMVGTGGVIIHGPGENPYDTTQWEIVRPSAAGEPDLNAIDIAGGQQGWIVGDDGKILQFIPPAEVTATATATASASVTATRTRTPTASATATATASASVTPTRTRTPTASATVAGTLTASVSVTATRTGTPPASTTASSTATAKTTATDTSTALVSPTSTESVTATLTPSGTATQTATPTGTMTPTVISQPGEMLFLPLVRVVRP